MSARPASGQTVTLPIELAHELDGLLTLLRHRYGCPQDIAMAVDQAVGELRELLRANP